MSYEDDEDEPWVEKPPAEYLRDLADRIHHIPVMHGVDSYDYSRLYEIARSLDSTPDASEQPAPVPPWPKAAPATEPDPRSVIVTAESLVALLRAGKKMKPVRWTDAGLFRDGYFYIQFPYPGMLVEHTPHTFGFKTSPHSGAVDAIRQWGDRWIEVLLEEPVAPTKIGGRRRF